MKEEKVFIIGVWYSFGEIFEGLNGKEPDRISFVGDSIAYYWFKENEYDLVAINDDGGLIPISGLRVKI